MRMSIQETFAKELQSQNDERLAEECQKWLEAKKRAKPWDWNNAYEMCMICYRECSNRKKEDIWVDAILGKPLPEKAVET